MVNWEGDNDLEAMISSFGMQEGLNQKSSWIDRNQNRATEHCGQV